MNREVLHVIIPYFNHTNARVNRRNLELCLRNLSITPECRVVLVEGIWNREAELPDFSDQLIRHLKFDLQSPIWVKENLINLGIASLGEDWEYAAWIDKDNHFLNPEWVRDTVRLLGDYDIVQPWSRVLSLNQDYERVELEGVEVFRQQGLAGLSDSRGMESFCHAREHGGRSGQWGHAWAIRGMYYRQIGRLFDRCIIGGGDAAFACSLIRDFTPSYLGIYRSALEEQARVLAGARTSYVPGTLIHYHHGDLNRRDYLNRFAILEQAGYDPFGDISYAENGTLKLSNPGLEKAILEYFYSREEHLIP
jgi:hypothetical protein